MTCKQKLGSATIGVAYAIGYIVVAGVFLVLTGGLKLTKLAIEQGEKLAIKGQDYCLNKAGENVVQAGSDVKEAYGLYKQEKLETAKKEEKVELIDEGYSSGSEENNSKLPSS